MGKSEKFKRITSLFSFFILLVLIAVQIYVLNSETALCRDDYSYSYTFAVKENKFRITNFREVIESQINHYKVMNGRAVTHTIAQTFLIFEKSVFNIFNTAAFVLLLYLISFHASPKKHGTSPLMLLAAFLCLWFFTPAFGDSYLWLTGACNYLWGILIILVFMLPLTLAFEGVHSPELTTMIVLAPIYFVFAVVAGFTNENTSAALLVMSVLFIIAITVKYRRFPIWAVLGFIGNICGFLLMILAPGQSARLDANGGFGSIRVWFERLKLISLDFLKYHGILLAVLAVLLVIGIVGGKRPAELTCPAVFFVGTLASVYSMILSPYFPERVWSGPTILLSLTLLSLGSAVLPEKFGIPTKIALAVVCCGLVLTFAHSYEQAYLDVAATKKAVEAREAEIAEFKFQGISEVELETISGNSRFDAYVPAGDLNDDSTTWPNTAIAMYYGLDEVRKK